MTDDEATRSAGAPDAATAAHRDAPAAQPPVEGASGAGLSASARSRRAETGSAYAAAGVDTEAGDAAVELMRAAVGRTLTDRVVGGLGGFAGMVDVSHLRAYRRPLLATSTDGVGTKIAIARALDVHDTIGQDLVGMVVDDIAVVGARPLLMTDYIACGRVVPERIADIVRGVARACRAVDVPLLGGETAEHPGLMAHEEYDIAGAATGVVEADAVLGAERVRRGDVVLALAASGLHSNGYSLVRRIVADSGWPLERHVPEFGRTLGEELLQPTRLYSPLCLDLAGRLEVHAFSHVTGGGLAANLARVALLPEADAEVAEGVCRQAGVEAWQIGRVGAEGASAASPGAPAGRPVPDARDGQRTVRGTKGADAGSVRISGRYA